MTQVVQQRGGDEHLGLFGPTIGANRSSCASCLTYSKRQPIHAETVLESRMDRRRINQRHQPSWLMRAKRRKSAVSINCRTRGVSGTSVSGGMRTNARRLSIATTSGMSRIAVMVCLDAGFRRQSNNPARTPGLNGSLFAAASPVEAA